MNAFSVFPIYLVPRGAEGRMPTLWEANLSLSWPVAIGAVTVTPQAYVYSLFNNQIPTAQGNFYRTVDPPGYPERSTTPLSPRSTSIPTTPDTKSARTPVYLEWLSGLRFRRRA